MVTVDKAKGYLIHAGSMLIDDALSLPTGVLARLLWLTVPLTNAPFPPMPAKTVLTVDEPNISKLLALLSQLEIINV